MNKICRIAVSLCWLTSLWHAAIPLPGASPGPQSQALLAFEQAPSDDAALELALRELGLALKARGVELVRSAPDAARRIILQGSGAFRNDREAASQAFTINPVADGLRVSSPGIGLVHGVFRLAESIRLHGLNWGLRLNQSPAFAERIFSYQGTLFDLPDEGYYFRDAPYVNEPVLAQQVESAKAAMRGLLKYGFNSVAFLNLNVEDYVNYDSLGDGLRVYGSDSFHRRRSEIFCRALTGLADYAHRLHLQLFLQIYEFSFPDHLDGRQLADDSELTWKFVEAKFSELFQRTRLDGIIVTATEPSPGSTTAGSFCGRRRRAQAAWPAAITTSS